MQAQSLCLPAFQCTIDELWDENQPLIPFYEGIQRLGVCLAALQVAGGSSGREETGPNKLLPRSLSLKWLELVEELG